MIKLYSLRVCGPSTDMEETQIHGLALDHIVTALLMLEVGDTATIEVTGEAVAELWDSS